METFVRWLGLFENDNKVDETTGLTMRQKKLVQNTWGTLRKNPVGTGVTLMTA